ncbi:MAG TPA: efflux RND transporter periplasmic adaptor subunit [Gammaproteobacteria bacterium]|nr:efflux RND transporter periplasmic adaptor subunit [Gammaproteobacteria bacterium]
MSENSPIIAPSSGQRQFSKKPVFIIIAITLVLLVVMILLQATNEKKDDTTVIPIVKTIKVEPIDYVVPILSEGMVLPKTQISFASEISGKVSYVAPQFTNGGQFKKDDVLVQIDSRDYELAITRAKANVAARKAALDLEQAKSDLAKSDWEKYGKKGEPSALNLNLPQVDSAKAALAGAQADLLLAQRNLEKTGIKAPFDGVIIGKNVDIGQFVNVGMTLATIASIETAEIKIALSDEQMQNIQLNTLNDEILVTITSEETNNNTWQGKVAHIEAQRDSRTLLNYAIIEVSQPFAQNDIPLRFNSFVNIEIAGGKIENVFKVSRENILLNKKVNIFAYKSVIETIHTNLVNNAEDFLLRLILNFKIEKTLYKIAKENVFSYFIPYIFFPRSQLEIREIGFAHTDKKFVYVNDGLQKDDLVIATKLSNVKEGSMLKQYSKYIEEQ